MTFGNFFDFNNAEDQGGELIPAKALVKVLMKINPGGQDESGWISKSDSGFEYLKTELTVVSEPYAKRKIFQNMGVGGITDGHQKAANITRSLLRAALESARNINPKDESDQARQNRQVNGWGDFNEIEFAIEVGIEKDKTGNYPDKNKVLKIITPDHSKYNQIMSGESIVPEGVQQSTAQNTTPNWGQTSPQSQPQEASWNQTKPEQQPESNQSTVPQWAQ